MRMLRLKSFSILRFEQPAIDAAYLLTAINPVPPEMPGLPPAPAPSHH
jgi:hypothetical protein